MTSWAAGQKVSSENAEDFFFAEFTDRGYHLLPEPKSWSIDKYSSILSIDTSSIDLS